MSKVSDKEVNKICRSFAKKTSIERIVRSYGLDEKTVKRLLEDNDELVQEHREKLAIEKAKAYEKLFQKSLDVCEDILNTSHWIDVRDPNGTLVGTKPDSTIIKVKKEIANDVIQSVMKGDKKKTIKEKADDKKMAKEKALERAERRELDQLVGEIHCN